MIRGITKFFFRPETLDVDSLESILRLHPEISESDYYPIAVNYRQPHRRRKLESALANVDPAGLEDMRVFDRADELLVAIGRILRAGDREIDVGTALFVTDGWESDSAVRLLESVSQNIEVTYAYSRPLDSGWYPMTETRIKRSWLFGSGGVEVVPEFQDWLVDADEFGFGGAKGLYPVNFLTESANSRLSSLLRGYDSLASRSGRIVRFTADDLVKIERRDNDAFRKYIHATSKG